MNKIKVLHILEATLGGTRRHVSDILLNINLEKFDVSFCYSTKRADKNFNRDLELISARGIKCVRIEIDRDINFLNDIYSFFKLFSFIKKHNFDIVHVHSSKAGFLGRIAAKLVSQKIKTVYTPNSLAINVKKIYKYLEKLALFFCDKIIAVSESERLEIVNSLKTEKVITINSGVFVYNKKLCNSLLHEILSVSTDVKFVVSVGRLTRQKDPMTFFETLRYFNQKYKLDNIHFVWIGDGELRSQIEEFLNTYNISNGHIIGWRTDVEELLWDANIFVLTSIYESFGYVTCEAMSHFLPVIATDVVGTRDIIIDKESGFLVPVKKSEVIADYIYDLINDDELSKKMGENGNKRVYSNFNILKMIKELEVLYGRIFYNKIQN